MDVQIRDMLPQESDIKGFLHWKTWEETYSSLAEERFVTNMTLERCQNIARRWPQNTLVLVLDGQIVGYSCYSKEESGAGEVIAIYLLKEVQGMGLGRKLMDAAMTQLEGCNPISLWVLKGNDHAIGFYEHCGFQLTGEEKTIPMGTELRMTFSTK